MNWLVGVTSLLVLSAVLLLRALFEQLQTNLRKSPTLLDRTSNVPGAAAIWTDAGQPNPAEAAELASQVRIIDVREAMAADLVRLNSALGTSTAATHNPSVTDAHSHHPA